MGPSEKISALSPYPIVDLRGDLTPVDGHFIALNTSCERNLTKGDACARHYESLLGRQAGELVQCPFGFSSTVIRVGGALAALTGIVPFPRIGGVRERTMAARHPDVKVSRDSIQRAIAAVERATQQVTDLEDLIIKQNSMALHEIRKLNRTIKQSAERLCHDDAPDDPDTANPRLVLIWKAAELMSKQFDVIEMLANESLVEELPLNTIIEPHKIFDKCIRIYRPSNRAQRITLRSSLGYYPKVLASDKTFPIIPTVLIQNALQYSIPGSDIRVHIEPDSGRCKVTVLSVSLGGGMLDERIFLRGVRGATGSDGTGNGLYVAQLVAKQHGARLEVNSEAVDNNSVRHTFSLRLPTRD